MEVIVNYYTHDRCDHLARCLHNKTQLPIYAIYDPTDRVYSWGIDYWHYFIKVDEDRYLNARGIFSGQKMKEFWADAWKDPTIVNNARIVEKSPDVNFFSNHYTNVEIALFCDDTITELTKLYADGLIDQFL